MSMRFTWLIPVAASLLQAQEASKLTARELFYREESAPVPTTQPKPKPKAEVPKPKPKQTTTATNTTTPTGVPVVQAAMHLGVRYNVLQITDREASKRRPVDPDKTFKSGDCVAIELTPNRSGFLYVFNRGTSGAWQPLLPSPDMPEERNRVANGQTTVIPSEHCFEFDGKAGTEKLLVVLTQNEQDAHKLSESLRTGAPLAPAAPPKEPTMLAMMREGQLIGRDIKLAKVGTSTQEGEPPNSVYAVRTSASATDRLVIEIALRHD